MPTRALRRTEQLCYLVSELLHGACGDPSFFSRYHNGLIYFRFCHLRITFRGWRAIRLYAIVKVRKRGLTWAYFVAFIIALLDALFNIGKKLREKRCGVAADCAADSFQVLWGWHGASPPFAVNL